MDGAGQDEVDWSKRKTGAIGMQWRGDVGENEAGARTRCGRWKGVGATGLPSQQAGLLWGNVLRLIMRTFKNGSR